MRSGPPLTWAVYSKADLEVISLLLSAGADVSFAGGKWPLLQSILGKTQVKLGDSEMYLRERPRINGPEAVALQKVLLANGYDLGRDDLMNVGWFGFVSEE